MPFKDENKDKLQRELYESYLMLKEIATGINTLTFSNKITLINDAIHKLRKVVKNCNDAKRLLSNRKERIWAKRMQYSKATTRHRWYWEYKKVINKRKRKERSEEIKEDFRQRLIHLEEQIKKHDGDKYEDDGKWIKFD